MLTKIVHFDLQVQSDRFFNALKGHGALCRLVILPFESHGYSARESIMHVLWETDMWLQKYCVESSDQSSDLYSSSGESPNSSENKAISATGSVPDHESTQEDGFYFTPRSLLWYYPLSTPFLYILFNVKLMLSSQLSVAKPIGFCICLYHSPCYYFIAWLMSNITIHPV